MSESRIQNAFSRTTILTVGRLLLFIVAGFAIGLLIGVVSEEPELLAGHVRGDTATVELDESLAGRVEAEAAAERGADGVAAEAAEGAEAEVSLPDVAAPPAGWDAGADDGGTDEPAAETAEAASAPPAQVGWAIQVGAFGDEPSARALATRLGDKGYPIEVLPAGPESNRWRVRVQPIGEEQAARGTAERIEREERLPTWVLRLEGLPRG